MVTFCAVLLILPDVLDLPPLADLSRFPPLHVAAEQLSRREAHAARLTMIRHVRGYHPLLAAAEIETAEAIAYWRTLHAAREQPFGFGEGWQRARLADLADLIGPHRYSAGWSPLPLPEEIRPEAEPVAGS